MDQNESTPSVLKIADRSISASEIATVGTKHQDLNKDCDNNNNNNSMNSSNSISSSSPSSSSSEANATLTTAANTASIASTNPLLEVQIAETSSSSSRSNSNNDNNNGSPSKNNNGEFDTEFHDWHAISLEEALARAGSSMKEGLTTEEVTKRLALFGLNSYETKDRWAVLRRLWGQIHNILIYILLVAGIIEVILGKYIDGGVIFGVLIINIIIGFWMETGAENSAAAIKKMLPSVAIAVRNGTQVNTQAEQVVPGDILYFKSGDKICADVRLIESRNLAVAEAVLTGESVPQEKSTEPVGAEESIGDQNCMAFSGTIVAFGSGLGVVVRTGFQTEVGKISKMVTSVKNEKTLLVKKIDYFGRWLAAEILFFAFIAWLVTAFGRNYSYADAFIIAISMAVAAIPEGLPAVVTIVLSRAVKIMAKEKAIVRQLAAVETLGAVTVICSDKTGTLTKNEMTVVNFSTTVSSYKVTGTGYNPDGEIEKTPDNSNDNNEEDDSEVVNWIGLCSVLCNDADLSNENGAYSLVGAPTEGAIYCLGYKLKLNPKDVKTKYPRIDTVPFESKHRFMATVHKGQDDPKKKFLLVKGAPEVITGLCDRHFISKDKYVPVNPDFWEEKGDEMRRDGLRTIGFAKLTLNDDEKIESFSVEYVQSLKWEFLGICGILDPPRPDAISAVKVCHEAGIVVKMITGDHPSTAAAIAAQLGIPNQKVLTGVEVSNMSNDELKKIVQEVCVFARSTPENKIQIIRALRALNQVVAMTGDGVNDSPALRQADIGIAMGINGTESAKEASKMVLADDNFATIAVAVREGRVVYANLQKTLIFVLPTNVGQAMVVFLAICVGSLLPINAVQILWVNMITSVTLGVAMAFELEDGNVMALSPRRSNKTLWDPILIWRMLFIGFILAGGVLGMFQYELQVVTDPLTGAINLKEAQTTAVNMFVMAQAFYLLNVRFSRSTCFKKELFTTNYMTWVTIFLILLLQVIFIYVPPFQYIFYTDNISIAAWGRCVAFGLVVFLIVEVEKLVINYYTRNWWRSFRRRYFSAEKKEMSSSSIASSVEMETVTVSVTPNK